MALIICPDCGNEVSTAAVACPKCGRPMSPPAFEERTVIREVAPAAVERDSFPKWIFIPLGLLGVVLIFLLIMLFSQEKDEQTNVSVNLSNKRPDNSNVNSAAKTETNIVIPPTNSDPMISNVPQTNSNSGSNSAGTPSESVNIDRGSLNIDAKVSDSSGNEKPVRAEDFYLLDKDLDSILNDADIEPINGQSLRNSFAISIVYPEKYAETRKKALAEISKHIKYKVRSDSSGKAQMKDIKPDSYYLFAITKTSNSFALWNAQIPVNGGQNTLSLNPQPLVEIPEE